MLIGLQLIGGLILLGFGADWLVRGSSRLALAAGLTPLVIGLTVVAFGTSMPELVTSVVAGLAGNSTLAVTNIVGSNIGNIGLILGLGALCCALPVQSIMIRRDLPVMVIASLLFFTVLSAGWFTPLVGVLFLLLLITFITWQIRGSKQEPIAVEAQFTEEVAMVGGPAVVWPIWVAIVVTIAGLATLVLGGKLLVDSAVVIAQAAGVSERIIGLTIVAIGTSLPELAATLVAVMRNEPDVAIGNVVGSNIFNILLIGGMVGMQGGIGVLPAGIKTDLWVMLIFALLAALLLTTQSRISRLEGGLMLACYLGYLAWLIAG